MRTKTLTLVMVGMILTAAVAVSYIISRPAGLVRENSMPIFMGEEVVIHKAVKGEAAAKVNKAVKAESAVKAVKAEAVPAPQPKVVAPLPIFPPRISFRVLPEYPVSALEQELEGMVILSAYVGLAGEPEMVKVKSSSGFAELDESAQTAVSQWKFAPATQGGQAIASWFEVPIRFVLR